MNNLLDRGVMDVIVKKDLEELMKKRKITVYLGIDPTSTVIHLGNCIALRKLRDFQNEGHNVIFLVGSFTALIGDTSDKNAMRKTLTPEEVQENFQTYKEQASKILDFSKCKIVYNADWLGKLTLQELIGLASKFTVQQMIEREMYQVRLQEGKPIGLHEFLYPLMQGYDSVALDVDLEIGGNDQLFNMLAGRTLQKVLKNRDKHVMTLPLIEGTDGRKMSKSYGNTININDTPNDQYGKIMSMKDELILRYFTLCTDLSDKEIKEIESELKSGGNPRNAKMRLGREIVKLYHGEKEAQEAEENFIRVFQKHDMPEVIEEMALGKEKMNIVELLAITKLAPSKNEARRLIEGGGVKIDNQKIESDKEEIDLTSEKTLQVGRRKFMKVRK
ncbi:MAG: tyrosine--tRNA ligase [Patescibacteria group bacterium]